MTALLLVALGGSLGAILRYGIGRWFVNQGWRPHWGTLLINATGALLLGVITGWGWDKSMAASYPFAGIGFLGGFTTFSTYCVQLADMISKRQYADCIIYLAMTVGCGFLLAAMGYIMTQ